MKDFEGACSVALVYYLGDPGHMYVWRLPVALRAAARCPAELRWPPARARAAWAARPPSGDCIVLPYPSSMPDAVNTVPGTTNSGRNGCRTGSLCWPRGLLGTLAARRLRAGGAAAGLFWSVQWAGRGRKTCFHHGGPVGRLYPASSHPPRPGAARLRHRGSRQVKSRLLSRRRSVENHECAHLLT